MLTDTKIRSLKPTGKLYKIADRDGLYVAVTPGGAISFRYNYRINGRQETLAIGAYGISGILDYVFPCRYEIHKPMSSATLNRVLTLCSEYARKAGQPLGQFGPHDMRRTGSTILHEAGYNSDWIEKALAHEQKGVRAVYNKAEYRELRKAMLQDWADVIDGWTKPA